MFACVCSERNAGVCMYVCMYGTVRRSRDLALTLAHGLRCSLR